MSGRIIFLAAVGLCASGCSSGSGLSTGSLFGGATEAAAPAAPAGPANDPTSRAFQVGSVSARAVKCGYHFDPAKLRTSFLATESTAVAPADLPRVEKVYDTAFNGVTKAVAGQSGYCKGRCRPVRLLHPRKDGGHQSQSDATSGGRFHPRARQAGAQRRWRLVLQLGRRWR